MVIRRSNMNTVGIVRKIDKLGRIVIPVEFRKSLGMQLEDSVEMMLDGKYIKMSKQEEDCIFCGSNTDTLVYKDKLVCNECKKALMRE